MRPCRPTNGIRSTARFSGTRIKVSLDGEQYIDAEDAHIAGSGAVGVWTKADSITAFDDFSWGGK